MRRHDCPALAVRPLRPRLFLVPPLDPPPDPSALKGIRAGIDEILSQQRRDALKLDELGRDMADVVATVTVHGRELRKVRETLEEHHERLVDLERLPRAKSMVHSIPPLASLGKETQSGSWIITKENVEAWTAEATERNAIAEAAEKWKAVMSGTHKVILAVVIAIVLTGMGLLAGALLEQAKHNTPALIAPER